MSTGITSASSLTLIKKRLKNPPLEKTVDMVLADAEIAELLLAHNDNPRRQSKRSVERYAGAMQRGEWTDTGDTIKFDRDGKLRDGQNRLGAVIEAAAEIPMTIVWGVPPEAVSNMDVQGKRQLAQWLGYGGEQHATRLGAAIRLCYQIESGGTPTKWVPELTYAEYREWCQQHPAIREAVEHGMAANRVFGVSPSPVAAAAFVCGERYPDDAEEFFTTLSDLSEGIEEDSPINALRQTLTRRGQARGSVSRMEQAKSYDVIIRAFDAHQEGVSMPNKFRLSKNPKVWRVPK